MAALIHKFHSAKVNRHPQVVLWGTGTPKRELMYVEDAADAAFQVLERYDGQGPVNLGVGEDRTVSEIAELVKQTVGYEGELVFDPTKPDGAPRKLVDTTRLTGLGWKPLTSLRDGVAKAYAWYLQSPYAEGRAGELKP
jgi:GDP-L-fucose synthase